MIAIIDAKRRYTAMNNSYIGAYNCSPEEIIGSHIWDVTEENVYEEVIKDKVDECMSGNKCIYLWGLIDQYAIVLEQEISIE